MMQNSGVLCETHHSDHSFPVTVYSTCGYKDGQDHFPIIPVYRRSTGRVCNILMREVQGSFARVNAASVVFPLIREHLTNLTQKAGISFPMLNPINFVALAKQEESKVS